MSYRRAGVVAIASVLALVVPMSSSAEVFGTDVTYTTDADFDQGTLVSVNHDAPGNDQLQLDDPIEPFPFINVAASGRGTVVRANTETGEVLGEYRTAPERYGLDPSRTTVDLYGNVWTANRGETGEIDGVPHGSAVKIGLVVGGTRVDAEGTSDPAGGYLAPPFGYNTCVDRDGDGLIRTSSGLLDILDWPDLTDGVGGPDGVVEDADDECILLYQRLPDAEQARHVSVDANNDVWVGGFPFDLRMFHLLDGDTGAILDSFDARDFGCGGYGGLVDGNGILWSIGGGWGEGSLLRYDPVARTGTCVNTFGGYGLGIDTNGYVWASIWENGIVKVAPDGTVESGYPKSTWQPPAPAAITVLRSLSTSAAATLPLADDAPEEAPDFWAAPMDQYVSSMSPWSPDTLITLTIADGTGLIHTDSQTSDGDGNFQFNLWGVFTLERGHLVTVTDGTTNKSHTVTNLFVDGVDVTADTVFGRADPGTAVEVWVHDTSLSVTATADGSGNWIASFAGSTDLTYASNGGSGQYDADGDATGVWWASPSFTAAPDDDWIGSMSPWTPDTLISLTIEDGTGVVYTDSQVSDGGGHFNFNLWDVFDVQRGHVVTVSDGVATKSHTVTNLFVDGIDVTADTVYGRADAGTDVEVWVHETDVNVVVTADGSGNWTADVSATADLDFGSNGGSQQRDDDGDSTGVWWSGPAFTVAPDDDWVGSTTRWTQGATVTLTIEDGTGVVYSDSQTVDPGGNFNFELWETFDVQRGHTVTVSSNGVTKTHIVRDYYVDGVDIAADTVFGRAEPGTDVHVWVHQDDSNVTVTADPSGNWTADFSGLTDLTGTSDGNSQQVDDDGDDTRVFWSLPAFAVAPDFDWVQSVMRWAPGSTVSLIVERPAGNVVYTDSQMTDQGGNFQFELSGIFDMMRGDIVAVSQGASIKTHVVRDLYVDGVDVVANTVSGRAAPNAEVHVWLHDMDVSVDVVADGAGYWIADLSGIVDLTYLSAGGAAVVDDDNDATEVHWRLPQFVVDLDYEQIRGDGWTPDAVLAVSVDGTPVPDVVTNEHGEFDVNAGFDLVSGQLVEVVGPMHVKTLLLGNPDVTDIDVDNDLVAGTAAPGAMLDVSAAADFWSEPSFRTVVADGAGSWTADFSVPVGDSPALDLVAGSPVTTYEWDEDGDATIRNFGPPIQANRGVAVTPVDNHVWVANSGVGTVTRLDSDGNVLAVIAVGNQPTGVAVDAAGKVWVTNLGSDNIMRIDPSAGPDGLGGVDLTVDLSEGASPYNYSDMTGAVVVGSTSPQGFWTVVQDSGQPGFEWGRITWNTEAEGHVPAGAEIIVEARTADTPAGLGAAVFAPVGNGELFLSPGRYIEVRVTLKASPVGESPVLSDIRVQPHVIEVDVDIKPGSDPNSINTKQAKGVVPVAVLGSAEFDVMTIDVTTLRFGPALAAPAHQILVADDHYEDIDVDGYLDLVSHYTVGDTGLAVGDTEACLTGATLDAIPIEGCDAVRIVK